MRLNRLVPFLAKEGTPSLIVLNRLIIPLSAAFVKLMRSELAIAFWPLSGYNRSNEIAFPEMASALLKLTDCSGADNQNGPCNAQGADGLPKKKGRKQQG